MLLSHLFFAFAEKIQVNFSVCYDQFLLHLARRGTTTDPLLQGPYFFLETVGSCSMS